MVTNPYKGSVFGPGDVGGKKDKEVAKPFAQVQVKGGRNAAQLEEVQPPAPQKPAAKNTSKNEKNEIWASDEVPLTSNWQISSVPIAPNETRIRPEVDVLYK